MEAFVVNPARIVSDVIGCIAELKNTFHSSGQPINDDDITLQKFCVKLETVLRYEQKEKYTILGLRKDYWNFITDVIPKDDGVKYVNMVPQMKTVQGKGRCFIRYALVKQTLADTIQRLLVSSSTLNSWYREDAILRNPSLSTALVNKLYDLNDVVFDLPCAGYELDISWPAFSRKTAKDGNTSGRRSSISSMSSVDFRNERRDPVIDLAAEVASLREFFNPEGNLLNQDAKTKFDNVSLASETPTITELTLQISNIHKRALKWKADFTNERVSSAHELRKAQDDRQFAIQESELKTKQLTEKFSNLAKTATEENERKISKLTEALSSAEAALQERDAELRELRDEINKSVMSSSTAHKSAMDIEKQLMVSERKRAEAESQLENSKQKLVTSQQSEGELNDREKRMKERIDQLKTKEAEYKDRISELSGQLKAKEIALDNIQESFENLTGMVFGSFEEVESNMKEKLVDREKGLQSQTLENRKLELQVTDLEHQLRKAKTALANSKSSLSSLESSYTESESSKSVLEKMLKDRDETLSDCMTFLQELQSELGNGSSTENVDKKTTMINDKDTLQNHFHTLSSLVQDIKMKLSQAEELNALNKNELTNKQDEILRLSSIIEELKQQIQQLEIEIQEKCTEINSLNSKLDEASGEVARTSKNLENAEKSLTALREDIRVLTEEKATMEAQVGIDREQLQQANEGRIKAESSQVNTEEELKNLRCVMEQEVAALKFQLSSETMKFEEEIKVLSEQNQESIGYRERCNTLEETVADLETSMKERTNEWEGDKRKYVAEIKRLRNQVQVLNNAMEGNKQRSMTLENDLILTTKQLEEEKHRQKETKQKVQDAENRKLESEKQLQAKMDAMKEDMKDLKSRIVSLTREKAELFEKALNFEHELKLKAADRWVEDKEAKNCSGCKAEFSFLLRRHHCRLCGRIFCYSCVNNWVRTAHSSKLKRVCNSCLSKDQRLKPQKAPQRRNTDTESDYDETMSDISIGASPGKMNTSTSSIDFSDDESAAAAARRTSPSTPKKSTIKEEDKDDDDEPPKEKIDSGKHVTVGKNENVIKELSTKTSQTPTTGSKGVDSPDGEGYEFIDQNEEIGELLESRIVISQSDIKEELTIPAVNDDEGISRELTVPLGTRYIVPVMVATPGAILCWSFKTVYKSIIFGLGYKSSESVPDDDVETLYPLARFESNVAPIEGEWKTSSHGVYVLVFDNCFSRFTSKQLSYSIHVKRRPSLLKSSPTTKEITGQEKR